MRDPVDPELLADMIPDSYIDGHVFAGGLADPELLLQDEFEDMDLFEDQRDGFSHRTDVDCASYFHDQPVAEDELGLMFDW